MFVHPIGVFKYLYLYLLKCSHHTFLWQNLGNKVYGDTQADTHKEEDRQSIDTYQKWGRLVGDRDRLHCVRAGSGG